MPIESEVSLGESLNRKLRHLFIALVLFWAILGSFRPMLDNVDLGWHVAQGRWMVEHHAFYSQDLLNYPNLTHSVIDEYPFFQVVLYFATCLGWWGPCLLAASVYVLLIGTLIRATRAFDLGTSAFPALAIGLMLLFFQVSFPLRPHVVTYLGVTFLGIFLLRHREETKWTAFWPVALFQIIWTNSHSAFVLGPGMVGLFGAEMVLRHAIQRRAIPWTTLHTWILAFGFILLVCLINPYGFARFGPPFFQDRLESIRAYVGEMEPLTGLLSSIYQSFSLAALVLVILAVLFRRGAISWSFILFAIFFYLQALTLKKAWPIFGLYIPLLVLSTGAFSPSYALRKPMAWFSVLGHATIAVLIAGGIYLELNPAFPSSISSLWREYDCGRTELSLNSAAWMKAHNIQGRFFHRCEDGGMLQEQGFDHAETFSDTGFGKYDEAFIHEVGLINEQPGAIPHYLDYYQPSFVICSTFCYRWPYYLRQNGWRPIFYSPNSSVWAKPGTRPDLPTLSDEEIKAAFDHDIATNGLPIDTRLLGRNLIALNSMGLEDFAFEKLTSLPKEMHRTPWYWEAARFLCFTDPPFSPAHRAQLLAEAEKLNDGVTAEFRAYALYADGDTHGAQKILESIPYGNLGNYTAELLLKIYLAQHNPQALPLALRTDCFDLRNGHHWQLLAEAEELAHLPDAAARAWHKAVFYSPDDSELMKEASIFSAQTGNAVLAKEIEASSHPYGKQK